jgi:hypothetical protein
MSEEKSCFDNFNFGLLSGEDSEKWKEKIEELYNFLRGEKIKNVVHKFKPKLSRSNAEYVIWFLQEVTGIIPQSFEFCAECEGEVYDSHREGHYSEIKGKFYCDYHAYDCGNVFHCNDCGDEVDKKQHSERFGEYLCDRCLKRKIFLEDITKEEIKSFSLELFTYLKDHPGKKGRKNLPERMSEKLDYLDRKCPLCKIFLPEDFDRCNADQKEHCDCNGCPLGNYRNCLWHKMWKNDTSEKTRSEYTKKIIALVKEWNTKENGG